MDAVREDVQEIKGLVSQEKQNALWLAVMERDKEIQQLRGEITANREIVKAIIGAAVSEGEAPEIKVIYGEKETNPPAPLRTPNEPFRDIENYKGEKIKRYNIQQQAK